MPADSQAGALDVTVAGTRYVREPSGQWWEHRDGNCYGLASEVVDLLDALTLARRMFEGAEERAAKAEAREAALRVELERLRAALIEVHGAWCDDCEDSADGRCDDLRADLRALPSQAPSATGAQSDG